MGVALGCIAIGLRLGLDFSELCTCNRKRLGIRSVIRLTKIEAEAVIDNFQQSCCSRAVAVVVVVLPLENCLALSLAIHTHTNSKHFKCVMKTEKLCNVARREQSFNLSKVANSSQLHRFMS